MIWNILLTAICVFIILRRTGKVLLASGIYSLTYFIIWYLIGRSIVPAMFIKGIILFVYAFVFFFILNKINFEENKVAFVIAFVVGTLIHTFLIG